MGSLKIDPRICDLSKDLLLQILLLVPTKDALATSVLSKRWRYVSKMLPELTFKGNESLGLFIDKSLQVHKAPKLISLVVELALGLHVDLDVRKWVEKSVNLGVQKLNFKLLGTAQPTSFPMSLYTCDTLHSLTLSNNILVDVSFPASLPSLVYLKLFKVVYKDEDSLARLLSSSPVLDQLVVERHSRQNDNLTNITVKVPSLKLLRYLTNMVDSEDEEEEEKDHIGSLVIDSPASTNLCIIDNMGGYCRLVENMPCLDQVYIGIRNHDAKFLTRLSSTKRLFLSLSESMIASCNAIINFSRLIKLNLFPEDGVNWLKSLDFFLQNSPTLKTVTMYATAPSRSSSWKWNQPSTIPKCLSSHLEILRWKEYEGKRCEKQLVTYILANSKCLKTVEISFKATCNLEKCRKELESMPRISTSSQLLYSTPDQADGWKF